MSVDSSKESQVARDLDMSWLANILGPPCVIAPRSYQICKRARPYAQHETALLPTRTRTRSACFASDLRVEGSEVFVSRICKGEVFRLGISQSERDC
jgi:hypothetical protein